MSLLSETSRRVHDIAAQAQAAGRVPSLVLAVVRDGALLHVEGIGEHPQPGPDTQYRLGSITKTLTATLVLQLRDAGAFALDDLVYRHLPGTGVGGVTVRQLLGHVSGLQREPDGPWWERHPGGDVEALLSQLAFDKLARPPWSGHHYSNLAYGLLGAILERVTGEPWATLVQDRILDPLAMTRTTYAPAEPYARGYVVHPLHGGLHEEPRHDTGAMAAAGQLWSTVTDMATWAAFLADPKPTVLGRDTVDEMCAPVVITDLESWTGAHGLGPELYRVGERVYVGHAGSMPGYLAQLVVHRRSRYGVITFANAYTLAGSSLKTVALAALTAVLDAEPTAVPPWRPSEPPTGDAAELCGRWWWMGREYQVDVDGADLVRTSLSRPGPADRYVREAPDVWRGHRGSDTGELLSVRRSPDGQVTALEIATAIFTRDPSTFA